MGILSWIVLGLIAGLLAKAIRPGADPGGWIVTILIGVAGGFLGGWIATMLGWGTIDGFNFRSLALATGGALVILWIYAFFNKRKK